MRNIHVLIRVEIKVATVKRLAHPVSCCVISLSSIYPRFLKTSRYHTRPYELFKQCICVVVGFQRQTMCQLVSLLQTPKRINFIPPSVLEFLERLVLSSRTARFVVTGTQNARSAKPKVRKFPQPIYYLWSSSPD